LTDDVDSCYFIAAFILFYCTCADGLRSDLRTDLRPRKVNSSDLQIRRKTPQFCGVVDQT